VHATLDCDVFFPELDDGEWVEIEHSEHQADEKNEFPFTFSLLERQNRKQPQS
jgi:dihydrofolate reductase